MIVKRMVGPLLVGLACAAPAALAQGPVSLAQDPASAVSEAALPEARPDRSPDPATSDTAPADGTPALHRLVWADDEAAVRGLLAAGADPNSTNRHGVRPVELAAANGNAAMIRLLVEAGADAEARNQIGETPLMTAVESGDAATVEALLAAGVDVDGRDPHYAQTALMIAARHGDAGIVTTLIDAGADIDAATRIEDEPAWILPNSRPGFSFGIGIVRGGLPADRGMRPFRPGGMTPLLYAAREGHRDAALLLLDAGAAIDQTEANGITPLLMAIANGRVAVARLLIERGAALDPQDWYGRSPLWEAVNVRNLYLHNQTFEHAVEREPLLDIVRLLLERGADPNPRTRESPPVREHLLAITGTLEWVDFTGQTPFLAAALAGDVTVMRLLLAHGADPHIPTFGGTTALMAAAGVNWVVSQTYTESPDRLLEAVTLCVELGMDVNAANSMGITAIHGAANRGSDDIIEFLAAHGARLDASDNEGRTPLDWARGVFLATHPAEPKPSSIALLEKLGAS